MRSLCERVMLVLASTITAALCSAELPVHAADSIIYLTKNTNNNQVHYGVELDDQCRAASDSPMYAYWRMLEKGPNERAKLMIWEHPGYGVRQPKLIESGDNSSKFDFVIRGVPDQSIRLESFANADGTCGARAYTNMGGREAVFERIDINVSGWANVHKVEIHGIDPQTHTRVTEITHEDPH